MILKETEVQRLNRDMLGLGAPVERDDTGYNKPDWCIMEPYGRYVPDFNAAQAYDVLQVLKHYKNTQLSSVAEDIEESLEYYKQFAPKMSGLSTKRSDYIPRDMRFVKFQDVSNTRLGIKAPLIILKATGASSELWDMRNALVEKDMIQVSIGKTENGAKDAWVAIPPTEYNWAKEVLLNIGRYGYIIHDADKIEANLDKWINQYKEALNATKKVEIISATSKNVLVHFDGFLTEINNLKSKYKVRSISSIRGWDTELPTKAIPDAAEIFKKYGYVFDSLEAIKMIDEEAGKAKKEAIEHEEWLKHWNESGNSLTDLSQYPLPFKPYPYQEEDAKIIVTHNRMLLGHDMGAGKTFIAGIVGYSIPVPKLAIVPETLRLNWKKEMLQINPNADVITLTNKDDFKIANDWTIIGYSTAIKRKDDILKAGIQCVFIDEAHRCKSVNNMGKPTSKRAEAVLAICDQAKYCYPMTGTPIPTSNKDLFNIMRMIKAPEVITGDQWDFFNFGKQYCNGYNNGFGWNFTGNSNEQELHEILNKYMVRRLKKDVLPNLTKQRVFIPIQITGKEYAKVEKQLANSSGLSYDTYMALAMTGRRVMSKQKLVASLDIAEDILDNGGSVVIVSEFNETLDAIMEAFPNDCCCIRGGMSDAAKQNAIDDFQSGVVHVCALNVIAGGVGVTLTKAHDMIVCDYDWTPANMSQVEDRICRSGQKEHCMIHYIYGDNSTFDKLFMDMISEKSANIDRVVDASDNTMDFTGEKSSKASKSFIQRLMELNK